MNTANARTARFLAALTGATLAGAITFSATGCDDTSSKSKTTTTKTEKTPEGTKTTTETHEKKTEIDKNK